MAVRALVVGKEEDFVLPDGAAHGATELVPVAAGYRGSLREGVTGEVGVRALEVKDRTVELVGAGFGLGSHHSADGLAEFSIVVLGGDLDFIDRLEVGVDYDDPQNRVLVVGAVQLEGRAREVLPLSQDLLRPLGVLAGGVVPAVHALVSG